LADDATNWAGGDRIVIASSDYEMNHAEEFVLMTCSTCSSRQVRLEGKAQYTHLGVISAQGVDMRAEVGLLSRNVRIFGEMQPACYSSNHCQFFNYDTFGGHVMMVPNFKRADFQGIELYNMGQQKLGRYPIHYHVVGKVYGSKVRELSIHNCFSRCVTLHGSEGLLVQDVVGYNTLGHCFFLEDGNEQNNQLIHNLGLLTKPGTLLPSDRDKAMCEGLLGNVYPGYIPNAEKECMETATFWIAHPNNTVRNNSAAGSVHNGFHYIFHRVPTGPSAGTLPPYHGERSGITFFAGNRAHSNPGDGLLIDRGVKVDSASAADPSEFLSMTDNARYTPHINRDMLQPRSQSYVTEFTSYMNHIGARVRGGDVWIQGSKFSDNDVAVIMLSDNLLPEDPGAHQEVVNSVIAATADFNKPEWEARTYPSVGVQLLNGPVLISNNHFYGYTPVGGREAYAIGFYPQNNGQLCTANTFGYNTATEVQHKVYFGRADAASIHGSYDMDGDLNQILYDRDGVLTGWPGAFAVRRDNYLLRGENCFEDLYSNSAICTGDTYGQLYVNATTKTANMTIERTVAPFYPVTLRGANKDDIVRFPDTTQFQAAVIVDRDYHIHFTEPTPSRLELSVYNFPRYGYAKLSIHYLNIVDISALSLTYFERKQIEDVEVNSRPLTAGASIADVDNDRDGFTFYWDQTNSLLTLKLVNHYSPNGYSYCAAEGCQFIRIVRLV
jgi:cell migration-inducing and hyaluronan-binding protein